ncbi:hypothetical protein [Halostella litorea]|uniref:hypothetical protein n=1 Tax=Halostella litorea TaxID=2528831 RepID=UPI001092AA66|nr:hypothetical protein [Halostella litorea]
MKRRALLAGLTGALAGCNAGGSDPTTGSTETGTRTTTATSRSTTPTRSETARTTERADPEPVPEEVFSLDYPDRIGDLLSVSMSFRSRQTAESPARVHVELTNVSGETVTIEYPPTGPVEPWLGHEGGDATLLFVPDDRQYVAASGDVEKEELIPDEPSRDGCWRSGATVAVAGVAAGTTLVPGGSVDETYTLVADPENEGCLPSGEYGYSGGVDREVGYSYETYDWSFAVTR